MVDVHARVGGMGEVAWKGMKLVVMVLCKIKFRIEQLSHGHTYIQFAKLCMPSLTLETAVGTSGEGK